MVVVVAALLRCGSGALRLCCGSVSLQGRHEAHRKLPLIATTSEITNVVPLDIRIIDITHRTHSDIFEPSSASPNTANQRRSINNRPAPPQALPPLHPRKDQIDSREKLSMAPHSPCFIHQHGGIIRLSSHARARNSGGITIIRDADRV